MIDAAGSDKSLIRAAVRESRAAHTAEQRLSHRGELTAQLAQLVSDHGATSVTCYLPTADEPDTSGFIDWARTHNVDVLLPVAQAGHRLEWARLGTAGTARGRHGLAEPIGPRLPVTAAAAVDLMIVPASAVDHSGVRMGWGLGYFDRALAALSPAPPVFAVVHDDEILPHIPADPHDVPITGVVTPSGIRAFPISPG